MWCPRRMKRLLVGCVAALAGPVAITAGQIPQAGPLTETAATKAVRSTFDPNGPNDHADLPKDPGRADLSPQDPAQTPQPPTYEPIELDDDSGDFGERGGPANDNCSSATIIPGNTLDYNNSVNNTQATTQGCEATSPCQSLEAGRSIWWRYTPDQSGTIDVNLFGSSHDLVLSVFGGCAVQFGQCFQPADIDCAGTFTFLPFINGIAVQAGEDYVFKVAAQNTDPVGGTVSFHLTWHPANDPCSHPQQILGIAYSSPLLNTTTAVSDTCDNEESCEANGVGVSNAVWYAYTPSCDGLLSINTNGSNYDTVLSVWDRCGEFMGPDIPCDYGTQIACDDDSGTGLQSQIVNIPVTGGVEYLIKAADYNTASGGGLLKLNLIFSGASPPTAQITDPDSINCVCGTVIVQGTAGAASDPILSWKLEYQSAGSVGWTSIATGTTPVVNNVLGNWNTGALLQGYYILRLTVQNACGSADTAVVVVFVDRVFDSLELREPDPGDIVGGNAVCIDGTVWDSCFRHYTVQYRPSGGGAFTAVNGGPAQYTTAVVNDPIVPGGWNTLGLPDGDYDLKVEAFDHCGHSAASTITVTIDNTPPVTQITAPDNCDAVSGLVNVIGTVSDDNMNSWALQYTGGPTNAWVTIASGSSSITNALIATWDTSRLPPCAYTLRLVAGDHSVINCYYGQSSEFLVSVNVGGEASCLGDLDGDGVVGLQDLALLLAHFATVCP
jgi:hypothetical protein